MHDSSRDRLRSAQQQFSPETTYLNTATHGLTPRAALLDLERHLRTVGAGRFSPADADPGIAAARATYSRLTGVPLERIAIGAHASQFVGTIAASLPPGSEVLTASQEFSSVVHPFLAREPHGVRVREVPLDRLADEVGPGTTLVAVSAVQSSNGALAPLEDLLGACAEHGARLMLDTTQAGWLPLPLERVDYTVCSTYKWLLGPRGCAFLTGTAEALADLEPLAANWYAATDPWNSLYGGPLRLADGARRLDLAPVWFSWVGLAPALELIEEVGAETIREHDAGLGDRLLTALDLPSAGSAIVSLAVSEDLSRRVREAGIAASTRNGRLRVSFHLYNTEEDVYRLVKVLTS